VNLEIGTKVRQERHDAGFKSEQGFLTTEDTGNTEAEELKLPNRHFNKNHSPSVFPVPSVVNQAHASVRQEFLSKQGPSG
jgi:hypothetical protein